MYICMKLKGFVRLSTLQHTMFLNTYILLINIWLYRIYSGPLIKQTIIHVVHSNTVYVQIRYLCENKLYTQIPIYIWLLFKDDWDSHSQMNQFVHFIVANIYPAY